MDRHLLAGGVLTTPPFVRLFSRSAGAHPTDQPWHKELLTAIGTMDKGLGHRTVEPGMSPFLLTFTLGGIHPRRVEQASSRAKLGDVSRVVSTSLLHLLALQLKPSLSV